MDATERSRDGWRGPAIIAIAALTMLMWSWGTWPDPLVDFGTQLYVPWQLVQGKVLYRDIAYYNGPLSQYVNALWFVLGGVSLRSLVWGNLLILGAAFVLVYRLAYRASGPLAATAGGIAFALVFAFNQGVGIGNFNWVTPYRNEITHGVVLGLFAVYCVNRYLTNARLRWLIVAGVSLGLAFLTKAEPFAAAALATAVQLAAGLWMQRAAVGEWMRSFIWLGLPMLAIPILTVALFAIAMPWRDAAMGVAGSWTWALDRQITSLPFYRHVQGFDDVPGNLRTMFWWALGYASLLIPGLIIALPTGGKKCGTVTAIVFVLVIVILGWRFYKIDWNSMITPLPICLLAALVMTALAVMRRDSSPGRSSLRLALVIFSMALLLKIILSTHVYHYGFAQAMPGILVLVTAVAEDMPRWIESRGGCGRVFRAVGLAMGLAGVAATFYVDAGFFGTKRWWIAGGGDAFRGSTRGLEVQMMTELINSRVGRDETVAVFPTGLMLNFLTRRASPTRYINFMPPEVLAVGEGEILNDLKTHPPGAIVIDFSAVNGDQFALDTDYTYGRDTLAWIRENYQPVAVAQLPPPYPTYLHLVLLRPKTGTRVSLPLE